MAMPSTLAAPPASSLPVVRLEVRAGANRPTLYEVGDGGFLIGSVPGCDLRLPGANLPPVLCLIARQAGGASLRKLAPVQPLTLNGRAVNSTYLNPGDKIALGDIEIVVRFTPVTVSTAAAPAQDPEREGRVRQLDLREQRLKLETGQFADRETKYKQETQELEAERKLWAARRAEIENEWRKKTQALEEAALGLRRQEQEVAASYAAIEAREKACRQGEQELERLRTQVTSSGEQTTRQAEEVLGWRKELDQLKQQLHERFRQKREKLTKMGQAVRKAALRIQRKKHETEAEAVRTTAARQEMAQRQMELEANREQFDREKRILEEQHRSITTKQHDIHREMTGRHSEVETRERKLTEERTALEKSQKQHQADLVRLDRIQGMLELRQKQLQERALEVDRRSEQLQRDTRELEEQAAQLDDWRERLVGENETLATRKQEHEDTAKKMDQRAAALESQQAMLATLRTRIEKMRDDLRRQEQELSEQRVKQEAAENEFRTRSEETRQFRLGLANEKELFAQERLRFEERRATLDQAVAQVRQAQESHTAAETLSRQRQEQVDATAAQQAEQAGMLLARGQQMEELNARTAADRQSLREREATLARSETTLAALQEQLRRRGDELAERERNLAEQDRRLKEESARHEAVLREWEGQKKLGADSLDALRLELSTRATQVEESTRDVRRREEELNSERVRLDDDFRALQGQRQALQAERVVFEVEKQAAGEATARRKAEFELAYAEAIEIGRQLSELEARGQAALERLTRGREQLREQLAELHSYSRQGRDDLETARKQLHDEAERVRGKELELHGVRDEHRLTVAAYRQQLVEWQGHLTEMRQTLAQSESRLDRRQVEIEERAQQVATVREELAQQAEQLQVAERAVEEQRGEMTRHLNDMREWYRKKMRELAGVNAAGNEVMDFVPLPSSSKAPPPLPREDLPNGERGILAMTGEVDAGDKQIGDLLRSLELIDADTLTTLLMEARRQRRSLRQLLLAGNYLTLYQMALIEAGNLDGLVLGPVRVVDRLKATPREAVYRVFDPRDNREALLRHLAEGEMQDAIRPDEFRQRFAAASMLQHAHLAATYEVLDIGGRPAVLQEWLNGLPSSDWPTLAAAPGVWYRLLSQAALALQTAHSAGLLHGQLQPGSFVLTGDGVLKLTGLGEPRWLVQSTPTLESEPSVAADLTALGRIAADWSESTPNRKGAKSKPLPDSLQEILRRLESDKPGERFDSAAALSEALEQAGGSVPANAAAWERFLKQVREQSEDVALRRTA